MGEFQRKHLTDKDYYRKIIEAQEAQKVRDNYKSKKVVKESTTVYPYHDDAVNKMKLQKMKAQLEQSTYITLMAECINYITESAMSHYPDINDNDKKVRMNIISNIIKENGGIRFLDRFYNSIFMVECANIIKEAADDIIDNANIDPYEKVFTLNTTDKSAFFDKISALKPEEILNRIRKRVAKSINDFNYSNKADRLDVQEMIDDMNAKTKEDTPDAVKESYAESLSLKVKKIERRPKNVFYNMVYTMSENALLDERFGKRYLTEAKRLNKDKVVDECRNMYAVLETVNTLGLVKVDKKYIGEVLSSLSLK